MFSASAKNAELIRDAAIEEILKRSLGVADALMGEDGEVYGDSSSNGADFLNFYKDLEEHIEPVPVPLPPGMDEESMAIAAQNAGVEIGTLPDGQPALMIPMPIRVLDHLRVVNPRYAEQLDRQYEREVGRLL